MGTTDLAGPIGTRIPLYEPDLGGNEGRYVEECVRSGWISSAGAWVERFEDGFAEFCGTEHAVSVVNGTAAIHLALIAAGIGEGDEVVLPTLTFAATANAVRHAGATPVLVDVDSDTWCIDPARVEEKVTPATRAVIPVHLYGHPADMGALRAIAEVHGLILIEDAAEAHGARIDGRRVGSLGDAGCFSFYGNKILTTGEGGMVTTDDPVLADRARLLKNHGMRAETRYWHEVVGYNYRLTNLQAAVGMAQLERIEEIIERKRQIAALYAELLPGGDVLGHPPEAEGAQNVYWLYSVLVGPGAGVDRDSLSELLAGAGIETRPFFIPMHRLPPFETGTRFPVADNLSARGLNLPSFPGLSDEDVERVARAVEQAVRPGSSAT